MKKTNLFIVLLVFFVFCLSAFSACSKTAEDSESESPSNTVKNDTTMETVETSEEEQEETEESQTLFEETFEFDVLSGIHPPATEENMVQDLIEELTNTKINYTMVAASGFMDKASVMLASGELPDMVYFIWQSIVPSEWIEQGAAIPLDELINEYGPNIAEVYNRDDIIPYVKHSDGMIYSVNNYCSFTYSTSVMIRYDWLSDLGLEAPKTVEEWTDVLTAFRDGDPDGNGIDDTVPWTSNNTQWFNAYGITGLYTPVDGELVMRYFHPNYEDALMNLKNLYAEKLIDQEYIMRQSDYTSLDELISTNKAGACTRTGNEATRTTNLLRETDPDGVMGYIEPIEGPGGQWMQARTPINSAAIITAQAEEPEKLVQYLNWLWSDEGIIVTNYGVEGVTYEMVDGEPVLLSPYDSGFEDSRIAGMTANWKPIYWSGDTFLTRAMSGKTEETLTDLERLTYEAYTKNSEFAFYGIPSAITVTESTKTYEADVLTPLDDMEQQVIMGAATYIDLLDLLAEVETELNQIISEVNVAYSAVMGN